MTIVEATRSVTGGIDTHGEVHVAAVLDEVGGLLGTQSFRADPNGYSELLAWFEAFGEITKVGVEGTGSYGAGIARYLTRAGIHVVEVDRQNRQARRQAGKSDPLDAVEAARAAQSGRANGTAKSRDGSVEAIRVLVVAKRSARGARIKALTQMRQLTFSEEMSEGGLVAQPFGVVSRRDEERGGSVGPDAEGGHQFGRSLFDQGLQDGAELGDLLLEGHGAPGQHPKAQLGQRDDVALGPGSIARRPLEKVEDAEPQSSARMDSGAVETRLRIWLSAWVLSLRAEDRATRKTRMDSTIR